MSEWRQRVRRDGYTILILDSGEAGMTEVPLQLEFERQGNRVIHAHWNDGDLHLERKGGITYLVSGAYEAKVHDFADNPAPLRKRVGMLVDILEEEARHPTSPGLRVKVKEDGLYLSYPPVRQEVGRIDGLIRVVSGWEDRQTIDNVLDLQERLEEAGVIPLNDAASTRLTESKIISQAIFEENGIPTPKSVCLPLEEGFHEAEFRHRLEAMGVEEFVVKGEFGSHGENNHYTSSVGKALGHIRELMDKGMGVVVQEKVPGPPGCSQSDYYRVSVLDGAILGWRSVMHPVGRLYRESGHGIGGLSDAQKEVALRVAAVFGQDHAGVDLGGTRDHPVVFETNAAPGLWSHQFRGHGAIPKVVSYFTDKIKAHEKARNLRSANL